jgi:coatomer subunit beta'
MGQVDASEGVDGSFDLLYEINDTVTSGKWVGDCFLYTNGAGRLNYSVAGQIQTLVHLETGNSGATVHAIIGYLAKEDRVYLIDKSNNVTSFKVMLAMLQYQTAVVRGDFDAANELLPMIPEDEYLKVARFLEAQGFKEEALAVTPDNDHKFDLACELGQLELGLELMGGVDEEEKDSTDTQAKWKKLSDLALKQGNFDLAESAAKASSDFSGLLLLYSATGDREGMEYLASASRSSGKFNVAFLAYFMLNQIETCIELLKDTSRLPEAAFLARTYLPSAVEEIVQSWKSSLSKVSSTAAAALATPLQAPLMFPDFDVALQVEEAFLSRRALGRGAEKYGEAKGELERDLVEIFKRGGGQNTDGATMPPAPPDGKPGAGRDKAEGGRKEEDGNHSTLEKEEPAQASDANAGAKGEISNAADPPSGAQIEPGGRTAAQDKEEEEERSRIQASKKASEERARAAAAKAAEEKDMAEKAKAEKAKAEKAAAEAAAAEKAKAEKAAAE